MRKLLLTLSLALFATLMMAQSFTSNNINYVISNNSTQTVEVTGLAYPKLNEVTSITIPSRVTYEGKNYRVTSIRKGAFPARNDIVNIRSITIGDNVEALPENCFSGYPITSIILGSGLKTIEKGALMNCYELESLTLPSGLTTIGQSAFMHSNIGHSITIPQGVTSIPMGAFAGTNIQDITFEGHITSLASNALEAVGLQSITFKKPTPPDFDYYGPTSFNNTFYPDAFDKVYVHVPNGYANFFKDNEKWGMFKNVVGDVASNALLPVTITQKDGKFYFSCRTFDVTFHSKIEACGDHTGTFTSESIPATTSYFKVSAYASKEGYENSGLTVKIFANEHEVPNADVNTDGTVNAADVVAIYNNIILGE